MEAVKGRSGLLLRPNQPRRAKMEIKHILAPEENKVEHWLYLLEKLISHLKKEHPEIWTAFLKNLFNEVEK